MQQLTPDTPDMSEVQIQTKAYIYLFNNYRQIRTLLFHVPNGGLRDKRTASQLKVSGVVPGVPDLLFIWKGNLHAIEVKKPGEYLSPAQKELHPVWNFHKIQIKICFSSLEIVETVLRIISLT